MELTGSDGKLSLRDLLRPGPILALVGCLVMGICLALYTWSHYGIDPVTQPELAAGQGGSFKYLVFSLLGIVLVVLGALLSLLEFSKR